MLMFSSDCYTCYRPQRSWGEVMFLHMSVILFTGVGGWGVDQMQAPPRDQRQAPPPRPEAPPWEQTPPQYQGQAPSPPGPGTPTLHAGRYGQRAGGMHPTGMQSCFTVHWCIVDTILRIKRVHHLPPCVMICNWDDPQNHLWVQHLPHTIKMLADTIHRITFECYTCFIV